MREAPRRSQNSRCRVPWRSGSRVLERFRALAIQSGSYATCGGPVCAIPALDAGHLPTLFLHGADDVLVPVWTMEPYHEALAGLGVGTEKMIQEGVGHAWIDPAPEAIAGWFQRY